MTVVIVIDIVNVVHVSVIVVCDCVTVVVIVTVIALKYELLVCRIFRWIPHMRPSFQLLDLFQKPGKKKGI